MNILIVDDEKESCAVLEKYLSMKGHTAKSVHSGEDALEECVRFKPDVALMDVKMPGMNGVEALRRIKKASSGCPVIMISAQDDEKTKREAKELGAAYFLSKPVRLSELLRVIETVSGAKPKSGES